jgi:hypothetical protein
MNNFNRDRSDWMRKLFPFFFVFIFLIVTVWIGFMMFMGVKYGPQVAESGINFLDSVSDVLKQQK